LLFELSQCREPFPLPWKYDVVIFDTHLYGEYWPSELRGKNRASKFSLGVIAPLSRIKIAPTILLVDEEMKDHMGEWMLGSHFHCIPQPPLY